MKVWVLTSQVNDYDQYGEYFEACFKEKPTPTQLATITGESVQYWKDNPEGGRIGVAHGWYNMHEIAYGHKFDEA